MKGLFKKKITIVILLLILISLIFTGIILVKMIRDTNEMSERAWFFEESIQTGQPVVLNNVYIISNEAFFSSCVTIPDDVLGDTLTLSKLHET